MSVFVVCPYAHTHTPILLLFFPLFLLVLFAPSLSMPFSTDAPPQDVLEEPPMDWADNDDDSDGDVSASLVSHHASPSTITAASSQYPTTPSSLLSQPSGLPFVTIAGLTHDELRRNPEFMRYVDLVGSLQELLSLWEKKAPSALSPLACESPAPPPFSLRSLFFFSPCSCELMLVPAPEPVSFAGLGCQAVSAPSSPVTAAYILSIYLDLFGFI
jgi:hypothetical protein